MAKIGEAEAGDLLADSGRPIPAGRQRAAREGRAGILTGAEGKPIGGSDREGVHRSLAHAVMAADIGERR
jgi:hypothetical protein